MNEFLSIEPLSAKAFLVAIFCGFIVGFERQWFGKPAGIRTSILVCTGASVFITLAEAAYPGAGAVRVLGSVVTGVGFLGAGMVLSKKGSVTGVTSAATIWVLASIGSLIGFGYYGAGIAVSLMTITILTGVRLLETASNKLRRGAHTTLKDTDDKRSHK